MRYILVINSRSKNKMAEKLDDAVNELSRIDPDLKMRIEMRFTEYPGHAADIATELNEQFGRKVCVIACGGDGTGHEIANALAFRNTPMMCLPFGTGNDFIKTVIPKWKKWSLLSLLRNLDKVTYKPVDLIKIDSYNVMGKHLQNWSRYMLNVASIGLDTKVQAKAKSMIAMKDTAFRRKTAYPRSAVTSVFGDRSNLFSYELELEDGSVIKSSSDKHTLISICNARYYGGGFTPAPDADVTDHVADICCVDDVKLPRALFLLGLYKKGKHPGHKGINMYRATSGIITSHDPSYQLIGNYDGEDFFGNRIRFEVFPEALEFGFFPEDGYKA